MPTMGRGASNGAGPLPQRLRGLLRAESYPHPAGGVEVIETQLSWVLIAGQRVYKIKRPVTYPFADFSTLEHRRRFCYEELRLNRRFTPDLYLEVCRITGRNGRAMIGGDGPINDYAVVMRRFDRDEQLDRLVRAHRVDETELRRFGEQLAAIHTRLPQDPGGRFLANPAAVAAALARNVRECAEYSVSLGTAQRVDALGARLADTVAARRQAIEWRLVSGRVRECHGDLHLSNVVRIGGVLFAFDCVEFEPAFRWIDVAQDVAFLLADLRGYGAPRLGNAFLNGYLEGSGDYHAGSVLPLYTADRALVRAKVMALLAGQEAQPGTEQANLLQRRHNAYLGVAERALGQRRALCLMMCGLPGSGKSWLAARLAPELEAIHVRSDLERKRLVGLPPLVRSHSETGGGVYGPAQTEAVYRRLEQCAAEVSYGQGTVIVDANFGLRSQRQSLARLCSLLSCSLVVLHCEAPLSLLRQRIAARISCADDASEADLAVLAAQQSQREPLEADEQLQVVAADTSRADVVAQVLGELRRLRVGDCR